MSNEAEISNETLSAMYVRMVNQLMELPYREQRNMLVNLARGVLGSYANTQAAPDDDKNAYAIFLVQCLALADVIQRLPGSMLAEAMEQHEDCGQCGPCLQRQSEVGPVN